MLNAKPNPNFIFVHFSCVLHIAYVSWKALLSLHPSTPSWRAGKQTVLLRCWQQPQSFCGCHCVQALSRKCCRVRNMVSVRMSHASQQSKEKPQDHLTHTADNPATRGKLCKVYVGDKERIWLIWSISPVFLQGDWTGHMWTDWRLSVKIVVTRKDEFLPDAIH